MNKIIGVLLIGLSLLTSVLVLAMTQISISIKEAASGNYSVDHSALAELPGYIYIVIVFVIILGVYLLFANKK